MNNNNSNNRWVVYVNRGVNGWGVWGIYKTPAEADAEVTRVCKTRSVLTTDFNIQKMEVMM